MAQLGPAPGPGPSDGTAPMEVAGLRAAAPVAQVLFESPPAERHGGGGGALLAHAADNHEWRERWTIAGVESHANGDADLQLAGRIECVIECGGVAAAASAAADLAEFLLLFGSEWCTGGISGDQ